MNVLFGNAEETRDEDPDGRKREEGNGAEAEDSNIEGSDEFFSIRIVREDGRGEEGFFEHDNVFYRARRVRSRVGLFLGAGRLLPDGVHPATDSFSHRTDMFNVVTTPVPLFFFSAFFAFIDDRCFVHEEFLS